MMQPPQSWSQPLPGYAIRPMGTSIPVNNTQQQPTPTGIVTVSMEDSERIAAISKLSYDAPSFEPGQVTSRPDN